MRLRLLPSIPGYRTLDRYILGKFLRTYIFGLLMMVIILVVFDYVEKVDDFTELKAPWKAVIFDYYLNFVPHFINQFSALFTFISVIFFTSKMAMQTEIVAILSVGVSFRRLMWTMDDASRADEIFTLLMGEKVEPRREYIEKHAQYTQNLDY